MNAVAEQLDAPRPLTPPASPPSPAADRPAEVLPMWARAQHVAARLAVGPMPPISALRADGCLSRVRAERIAAWYLGSPFADAGQLAVAYAALADDVADLARAVSTPRAHGGLGVRVALVDTVEEPYADAAQLCDDVRLRATMRLRAAAADAPHPLLGDTAIDRLRVVHDVLGHAALGLGFDLQSEYAAWLFCRPLFSPAARPAAFCELVGRVTAYVLTGVKPEYRADLPPAGL